jgi:hypothetical protein
MKRREFITLLGGAAAAWPFAAGAQQPGMPVIGFLGAATPAVASQWLAAFVQRLDELGWVGGRNVMIEVRWAEGRGERAAEIAAEFVRSKVNIVATWSTAAALAAKSATSTIPVVRSDARQRDVAGGDPPQTMTPARGREMIDFVRAAFQVSIRRACRTVRHAARHIITDLADPSRRPSESVSARSPRHGCDMATAVRYLLLLTHLLPSVLKKMAPSAGAICESIAGFQEAAFVLTDLAGVCLVTTFLPFCEA